MRRILMVTVATIILLWSTTPITAQASSSLQTRSFRTNLIKGEYADEAEESVDDGLDDATEEIITDPNEIEKSEESVDEHTDVSTPTDIESVVDEEAGELEEPTQSQLDVPENAGDSTVPEVETPMDSEEKEEHETEVQSTQ